MRQTIVGSGGAIGIPLAKELRKYTKEIRLVSRMPKKVNDNDELFSLDVNDFARIDKAIEGSEVVYVTIGFKYSTPVWKKVWPPFMLAVIAACKKNKLTALIVRAANFYAKELNTKVRVQKIPKWMLQIFDSSKFEKRFGVITTSPEEGVKRMMQSSKVSD